MKANKGQIERALDAPPADVRLFLLYGPDEAGSQALTKRLERAMGPGAERIDLDGPLLKGDPARLSDEAASLSMFGDKRWIRISPCGDEAAAAIQALLDAPIAGNPVVALAGALKPGGALLKLALAHPAVMACANYMPEGRDAEQLAAAIGREHGLRLQPEIAQRIARMCGGDRALMAGELEKLALYLDAAPERPAEATHDALDALSAGTGEEQLGVLVNAVMGGDLAMLNRELMAMRAQGSGDLAGALRSLIGRAMLIAGIRAQFERDGRLDAAVEAAGKAVFWKDKGAVQRQVRLWRPDMLARLIRRLSDAERATRSTGNAGSILAEQEMLAIARAANASAARAR